VSTFVPLNSASRVGQYLAPRLNGAFFAHRMNSKFGVEIRPVNLPDAPEHIMAELLSGKEAGTLVTVLAANQRAVLRLGTIAPPRYQALLCANPDLAESCTLQFPTIVEPHEEQALDVYITAYKQLDLAQVDWWLRIYLTE
jgi:hypothetical protein